MTKREKNTDEIYIIDFLHVVKTVWKWLWLIVVCGILAGTVGFFRARFFIPPTYSATVMLYVNNGSLNIGDIGVGINYSDMITSQLLVKTCEEILDNRTTLEMVIEKSDLSYTHSQLSDMISSSQTSGTQIMYVTVECEDPYEAVEIANTIADVLSIRVADIVDGVSMEVVDYSHLDLDKIAPDITGYTIKGALIGAAIAAILIVIWAIMDDAIYHHEYVLRAYDYPVLAHIPDFDDHASSHYGSYARHKNKNQNTTESE